mgnify:CR=1 FL=1
MDNNKSIKEDITLKLSKYLLSFHFNAVQSSDLQR